MPDDGEEDDVGSSQAESESDGGLGRANSFPQRKNGKAASTLNRRPAGFWSQFNDWSRSFVDTQGRRPSTMEVESWFELNAAEVWPDENTRPSLSDTRVHGKSLRSTEAVKNYFRLYRSRGRGAKAGSKAGKRAETINRGMSAAMPALALEPHGEKGPGTHAGRRVISESPERSSSDGHKRRATIPQEGSAGIPSGLTRPASIRLPISSSSADVMCRMPHHQLPPAHGMCNGHTTPTTATSQAAPGLFDFGVAPHVVTTFAGGSSGASQACLESAPGSSSQLATATRWVDAPGAGNGACGLAAAPSWSRLLSQLSVREHSGTLSVSHSLTAPGGGAPRGTVLVGGGEGQGQVAPAGMLRMVGSASAATSVRNNAAGAGQEPGRQQPSWSFSSQPPQRSIHSSSSLGLPHQPQQQQQPQLQGGWSPNNCLHTSGEQRIGSASPAPPSQQLKQQPCQQQQQWQQQLQQPQRQGSMKSPWMSIIPASSVEGLFPSSDAAVLRGSAAPSTDAAPSTLLARRGLLPAPSLDQQHGQQQQRAQQPDFGAPTPGRLRLAEVAVPPAHLCPLDLQGTAFDTNPSPSPACDSPALTLSLNQPPRAQAMTMQQAQGGGSNRSPRLLAEMSEGELAMHRKQQHDLQVLMQAQQAMRPNAQPNHSQPTQGQQNAFWGMELPWGSDEPMAGQNDRNTASVSASRRGTGEMPVVDVGHGPLTWPELQPGTEVMFPKGSCWGQEGFGSAGLWRSSRSLSLLPGVRAGLMGEGRGDVDVPGAGGRDGSRNGVDPDPGRPPWERTASAGCLSPVTGSAGSKRKLDALSPAPRPLMPLPLPPVGPAAAAPNKHGYETYTTTGRPSWGGEGVWDMDTDGLAADPPGNQHQLSAAGPPGQWLRSYQQVQAAGSDQASSGSPPTRTPTNITTTSM